MASKNVKKLVIERFSLTSSRPFDAVVAVLKAGVPESFVKHAGLFLDSE